jgi:hypothetical protein
VVAAVQDACPDLTQLVMDAAADVFYQQSEFYSAELQMHLCCSM